MKEIKLKPRQLRHLMVAILLTSAIALPLSSQPLGLATAWADTQPSEQLVQESGQAKLQDQANITTQTYYEGDFFDDSGLLLNRGSSLVTEATDSGPVETVPEATVPVEWAEIAETAEIGPVFTDVDYMLYISANDLNFRVAPTTDSASLDKLAFCDQVQCIGEGDDWVRVIANGQVGYVYRKYTSEDFPFEDVSQTVYVSANTLNLRTEPSTSSEIITKLSRDNKLTRTGIGNGWSRVKTSSGLTGYVASRYITTQTPISVLYPNRPTYSGDVGRVVDLAYSALGIRYVWGGASTSGMDCSGLVQWVYKQVGISLPHQSGSIAKYGQSVSYSNMKAGDVICFDLRYDGVTAITHVGIYVGGGYMIDASTSRRKVVRRSVSGFLSYYSGDRIVTIRRLIS